jgi:hypothetical protein
MELHGSTPVDTLYEFAGYAIGNRLSQVVLWTGVLPTLLIGAALLRLLYLGYQKESFFDLVAYPLYVLFITFLVWPVDVALTPQGPWGSTPLVSATNPSVPGASNDSPAVDPRTGSLKVPRVLAVVHTLTDLIVGQAVFDMEPNFKEAAFAWQRVAAVNEECRIFDVDLRDRFYDYFEYCYKPAIASGESPGWSNLPLLEAPSTLRAYETLDLTTIGGNTLLYELQIPCTQARSGLLEDVQKHVQVDAFHRASLQANTLLAAKDGASPAQVSDFYLRRVLYNEAFSEPGRNEVAMVRRALPEYRWFKDEFKADTEGLGLIASSVVNAVSSLLEWWTQKALGPSTYYRISVLAPYLYGLITAVLLMVFPIAGLMAFWPRGYQALVHFLKVFLSVKLWPLFWAFLSRMNVDRAQFDPSDPGGFQGTFGQSEMFTSLAAMYLLVPVLSFMIVGIMSHCAQISMGSLVGAGATGTGTAAAAASQIARAAAA